MNEAIEATNTEPDIADVRTSKFNISYRTRGSDTVARQMMNAWRDAGEVDDDNETDLSTLAFVLSVTLDGDIGWFLREKIPATQEFFDWFKTLRGDDGLFIGLTDERCMKILKRYDESVPSVFFWNVWLKAYSQAQVLFPSAKTIAPERRLTDDERDDEDLKKSELNTASDSDNAPKNT